MTRQVEIVCDKCGSYYRNGDNCNICGKYQPVKEIEEKRFSMKSRPPKGALWNKKQHKVIWR